MPIYHLSVKTISRSHGRSATAAAAYRAGAAITDERTGEVHDYKRKKGVDSATLFVPENCQKWTSHRASLWNAAEQAETRKNSTVAREFEIALPAELPAPEKTLLAHAFAAEIVAAHGCAADVAIHQPGKGGDSRNFHAHILCTTRRLTSTGFTEKTRELDDKKTGSAHVLFWRERWAEMVNASLEKAGVLERVDYRKKDGIDAPLHLGPAATAIERKGEISEKTLNRIERLKFKKLNLKEQVKMQESNSDAATRLTLKTLEAEFNTDISAAENLKGAELKAFCEEIEDKTLSTLFAEQDETKSVENALAESFQKQLDFIYEKGGVQQNVGTNLNVGPILSADNMHAVQKVGRNAFVIHKQSDFDNPLVVSADVLELKNGSAKSKEKDGIGR